MAAIVAAFLLMISAQSYDRLFKFALTASLERSGLCPFFLSAYHIFINVPLVMNGE
jgi:hypothetical protein